MYVDVVLARFRYKPEPLRKSDPSDLNTKYPLDPTGPSTAIPAKDEFYAVSLAILARSEHGGIKYVPAFWR